MEIARPKVFIKGSQEKLIVPVVQIDFENEKEFVYTGASWYSKDEVDLIRCTGLKDCNKEYIYEGDILAVGGSDNVVVVYQPPSFVMKRPTKNGLSKQWHTFALAHTENQLEMVIGNIYQHKELLEKSE